MNDTPLQQHAADLESLAADAASAADPNTSRKKREKLLAILAPALHTAALKARRLSEQQASAIETVQDVITDLDAAAKADIEAHPEAGPNLTRDVGIGPIPNVAAPPAADADASDDADSDGRYGRGCS